MRGVLRRVGASVGALLLTVGGMVVGAPPASAAAGDVITRYDGTYRVEKSGLLHVTEVLDIRFAQPATSHGYQRTLTIREPYDPDPSKARVYKISNVRVQASDGASSHFKTSEVTSTRSSRGRSGEDDRQMVIRIGDPNRTLSTNLVTYTIAYDVEGTIISPKQADELNWDVVPGNGKPVQDAKVSVIFPDGVPIHEVSCFKGAYQSTEKCDSATSQGSTATFRASNVGSSSTFTVSARTGKGSFTSNQPILVDSKAAEKQRGLLMSLGATAVTSVVSLLGALAWWRRRGRDERFLGVPPGLMPAAGDEGTVGRDNRPQIPVQFSPPSMTVGEAGLLVDGAVDVRDTTATLVQLAVNGALRLNADPEADQLSVTLVDPSKAVAAHERLLLDTLFAGYEPGATMDLGERSAMLDAHREVTQSLLHAVAERGWFKHLPSGLRLGVGGLVPIVMGIVFFFPGILAPLLANFVWLLALVPIGIALAVIGARSRRGQRSATGRAYADQVEGFRTYLTTAEAEQLRFEEGEDIFSRYLPWAIMFGVAERWTQVCQRLVELGRISDVQPSWYYGPWGGYGFFPVTYIDDGLSSASMPPVHVDTSSSSGSGDSFSDGGGFSGGGGGGGSMDTW